MAARRALEKGGSSVLPLPAFASLPPLPPVSQLDVPLWVGPTEESNWVIHPALIVGAYPSSTHDATNSAILTSLLKLGVTTFVCLQQEYQHEGVTEAEWRTGAKLRPYIFDAIRLVDTLPEAFFPGGKGKPSGLEFVHFPIQGALRGGRRLAVEAGAWKARFNLRPPSHTHTPQPRPFYPADCAIANDASVLQLARDLCARLLRGETMYVHWCVLFCGPPSPPPLPLRFAAAPSPAPHPTPTPAAGAATAARAPWCRSCWASSTACRRCRPCAGCSSCTTCAWRPWARPRRRPRRSGSR